MKDLLIKISIGLVSISLIIAFIYYSNKGGKAVSYNLFYEDMVKKTIEETVKQEALKEEQSS